MSKQPLITHRYPDDILAYRAGRPVAVRQFLADVDWIAGQLPAGRHVLNMCRDRYCFTVVFAACIVSHRVSLLPATHTPEMIRQMRCIAPDVFCVTDQSDSVVGLPTFRFPARVMHLKGSSKYPTPQIDGDRVVAHVFTSGSTGSPVPHQKRWDSLVCSARCEAERFGVTAAHAILGTIPAQHMYGLESTVLMPLQTGGALHAGRPFYPADICAALEELPRPRMLVTTPYHLRALLEDQSVLPAIDHLLSATAPLSQNLAREAESRFAAPLLEIYGCTETGQIASRRTTAGVEWETLPKVQFRRDGEYVWAEGGHIDTPTRLSDVIELCSSDDVGTTRFLLHGRRADMVNIVGKRTSLAYLNYQLNAISGVCDGIFLPPKEEDHNGVARLSALVVAPNLTPAVLMRELRERIDPIFLPRPLLFTDALPRNDTGKVPIMAVQDVFARCQRPTVIDVCT